jgi:hypothetical protein
MTMDEDLRKGWDRGAPMEANRKRKSSTTVLSVRLPDQTFIRLTNAAKTSGKAAGTFARELIERALDEGTAPTPEHLARLFVKWVGEAAVHTSVSDFEITYSSPAVSRHVWVSHDVAWGVANYNFANVGLFTKGYAKPVTVETSTNRTAAEEVA